MDLTRQLRMMAIPGFAKAMIVATLAAIGILTGYVVYRGFLSSDYSFWIAAGASLLAVILPFAAATLVLVFSAFGANALRIRLDRFLGRTTPGFLAATPEPNGVRFGAIERRPNNQTARVETRRWRGESWADYRVTAPDGAWVVLLRLEVNVRKANLVLWLAPGQSAQAAPMLSSALNGAKLEGWGVNDMLTRRVIDGEAKDGLVLVKSLSPEFLWDAAEQVHFIQDLVFFLRACVAEAPALFSVAPKGKP
jgi:hypothetical protein